MKYQLQDLTSNRTHLQHVWVHSHEMSIYLLEVAVDGKQGMVFDGERPARFAGIEQVRETLSPCQIEKAELVHQSTYDEMIGNPKQAGSMKLSVNLSPSQL